MLWRFDPMTSAYMLDGEDLSQAQREQTLQSMAQDLVNNIRDFNYFTEVYWNQERQVLAGASVPRVEVKGLNVSFSFYLSFEHPLSLEHASLDIRVFDPSYYIDMAWRDQANLELAIELQSRCSKKIIEPKPSAEQVSYALALPSDASPDTELGQLFTQHGLISCD